MIEQKTMLDRVELSRDGSVSMRLALIIENDGQVLSTQYHRLAIDIHGDVVEQMGEVVAHLGTMGYPPLPEPALQLLRSGHQLIKDYLGYVAPAPEEPEEGGLEGGVDPADDAGDPGQDGIVGD